MRSVAYAAAILAAAGIMYYLTSTPAKPVTDTPAAAQLAAESESSVVPEVEINTASLTLNVPEMHCPFACYPSVKKNLEERSDIVSVELAPQKEAGIIDNPQVIVTYKSGFDSAAAISTLAAAGFAGSSVVQP